MFPVQTVSSAQCNGLFNFLSARAQLPKSPQTLSFTLFTIKHPHSFVYINAYEHISIYGSGCDSQVQPSNRISRHCGFSKALWPWRFYGRTLWPSSWVTVHPRGSWRRRTSCSYSPTRSASSLDSKRPPNWQGEASRFNNIRFWGRQVTGGNVIFWISQVCEIAVARGCS